MRKPLDDNRGLRHQWGQKQRSFVLRSPVFLSGMALSSPNALQPSSLQGVFMLKSA